MHQSLDCNVYMHDSLAITTLNFSPVQITSRQMKLLQALTSTLLLITCPTVAHAQSEISAPEPSKQESVFKRLGILNKLETGITLGTTGFGIEVASPVTEWAKVRVGASFMPHFSVPLHFGITTYTDGTSINSGNFGKIQDLMNQISGYEMDDRIDVDGTPRMANYKFLVDIYPLKNDRRWHVTLGFYAGPRRIAKAINTMEEMPSLLAIGMYNRLYDASQQPDFIENISSKPIFNNVYIDPEVAYELQQRLADYGRLGVYIGDFKDGRPYYMEPDKDGTVKANAYVNTMRWYTGLGYTTSVSKDQRWNIGLDLGIMYWGGAPKVITHEGVNMTDDLVNIRGKVGDYMKLIRGLKVYPTFEFKFSYTFF